MGMRDRKAGSITEEDRQTPRVTRENSGSDGRQPKWHVKFIRGPRDQSAWRSSARRLVLYASDGDADPRFYFGQRPERKQQRLVFPNLVHARVVRAR
jgi:hypothetical protein